jgi:hypothetical protein
VFVWLKSIKLYSDWQADLKSGAKHVHKESLVRNIDSFKKMRLFKIIVEKIIIKH